MGREKQPNQKPVGVNLQQQRRQRTQMVGLLEKLVAKLAEEEELAAKLEKVEVEEKVAKVEEVEEVEEKVAKVEEVEEAEENLAKPAANPAAKQERGCK